MRRAAIDDTAFGASAIDERDDSDGLLLQEQRRVIVSAEGVISVHRPWAPSPQLEYSTFDLREALLPPTPFRPCGTSIAERFDLREAIIQGLNAALRSTSPSKSQHRIFILRARCLAKTIEFGWISGVYRMSDWTPEAFAALAAKLGSGGWSEALDVHTRVDQLLAEMTVDEIRGLWIGTHAGRERIDGKKLARLMHCNIASHEVHRLQDYVALRLHGTLSSSNAVHRGGPETAAWSRTALRSELSTINLFSNGSSSSLSFCPYPKTTVLTKRFVTVPEMRTRSMGPDEAAVLLKGAVRWIELLGPLLHTVLQELFDHYEQLPEAVVSQKTRSEILAACTSLPPLEVALGCKVVRLNKLRGSSAAARKETSLHSAIKLLYAACFIVITLFNARRKDEVQHPVIGLQTGSLSVANKDLKLYMCSFFIEKTVRDYVPFYVGQLTAAAINTLVRFSDLARDFSALKSVRPMEPNDATLRSIFSMPNLPSTVGSNKPAQFDFYSLARSDQGMAQLGCEWIPKLLRPHMLRRAYALIFHYRYENATLLALAQQLQHLDIEMTRVYVSDTAGGVPADTGISMYGRLTPAQRRQIEADRDSLDADLKDVAQEKLMLFVESVVVGRKAFSGGYARLVQRFHQQLGKAISYSRLDIGERADQLGKTLVSRGHEPHPMAHGTCMAGTNVSRLRGHCFDMDAGALDRSNATPSKCARCPYHIVADEHLRTLQAECERAESEIRENGDRISLQLARKISDLASLRRLVELHARRLSQTG